nr:immunoglobulin heavy chain junction region [Mus musculus]
VQDRTRTTLTTG